MKEVWILVRRRRIPGGQRMTHISQVFLNEAPANRRLAEIKEQQAADRQDTDEWEIEMHYAEVW